MHQNLYLHLLFNQCTSMLTDIWYKDALLIKRRTFEMFGHGFIQFSSCDKCWCVESKPISVFHKEVLTEIYKLNNNSLSCSVSPLVFPYCAIYACCQASWAPKNAEQPLNETASTFLKENAYFYTFWRGQAHLLQLHKQQWGSK